jgi:hypothetical protein
MNFLLFVCFFLLFIVKTSWLVFHWRAGAVHVACWHDRSYQIKSMNVDLSGYYHKTNVHFVTYYFYISVSNNFLYDNWSKFIYFFLFPLINVGNHRDHFDHCHNVTVWPGSIGGVWTEFHSKQSWRYCFNHKNRSTLKNC